jgi:hypothetical protein
MAEDMAEDDAPALPPCGIYRTRAPIGSVPQGRLVYFHNHGDPGPGLYLPASWRGNRARFDSRGHLLPDAAAAAALEPLSPQGFYRVVSPFHCCDERCRRFEPDALVQLGYDASAQAILFVPEWIDGQLAIPERGTRVDRDRLSSLAPLRVPVTDTPVHDEGADEVLLH